VIELAWTGDVVQVALEGDDLELVVDPQYGGRLIYPATCPAGHLVELAVRNLVDLYLALEGARPADECRECHDDPPEVSTWSVAAVEAGDTEALLDALDSCPPHDVSVIPCGNYLHVISGWDA
jgi:hypothetical protein